MRLGTGSQVRAGPFYIPYNVNTILFLTRFKPLHYYTENIMVVFK